MSKDKKQVYKPKPISGFPEWIPEVRYVEQQWFDHIRRVFESYGFCSIETPSVEELDVISAKGEVDKEIYVLERLHADPQEAESVKDATGNIKTKKEARLALHFDQTVPLARYVAQHFGDLVFPFKRYQTQRVWRGERPQAGRFREFYQCDIDVIGVDNLPLHFDAEMPAIIYEVLSGLPGMKDENFQLRISNRKILLGFLESIGIKHADIVTTITRQIDKLEKTARIVLLNKIAKDLENFGYDQEHAGELVEYLAKFIELASKKYTCADELQEGLTYSDFVNTSNEMLKQGIEELCTVMDNLSHLPEGAVVADLSIVRGLDYYTGTVYETTFIGNEDYGSICSGGRYDDLASSYINKKLPGVGISIGFSRLFSYLLEQDKLPLGRKSPADILMVLPNEDQRALAAETAQTLRKRGYNVELYHAPQKIGKQIAYAEKKAIPYVWFPPFDENGQHEVKDMSKCEQSQTSPEQWTPNKGTLDDVA